MRGNFITDKHGTNNPNYKDGRKGTRLYSIYNNMLTRCYNSNSRSFAYYGGRGITICDEWLHDFQAFYNWAISHGYRDDLTIDRIDVNGNYEPNNCRWVTRAEQNRNTRQNHFITYNGETRTLREWANILNINYSTLISRIDTYGWTVEEAFTTRILKGGENRCNISF